MCAILGARLLSVFQILVLGIPAVVLTLVSMILCPCFIPGCGRTNRERGEYMHYQIYCRYVIQYTYTFPVVNGISFWGSFLSSMLLLPFTCLGVILVAALYCFLATISFVLKAFSPQARRQQGTRRANTSSHSTPASRNVSGNESGNNAAISEDFIRELEGIFERVEEGTSASSSS